MVKRVGFEASYVESLPPSERDLYILLLREEEEAEAKAGKESNTPNIASEIKPQ